MPISRKDFDDIVGTKPLESFTEDDFTSLMALLNEKNGGENVSIVFADFQNSGTTKDDRKKFLEEKFGIKEDATEEKPISGEWNCPTGDCSGKDGVNVTINQQGEHGGKRRSRKRRSSKKKRKNKKSKKSRKAKKSRKSRK